MKISVTGFNDFKKWAEERGAFDENNMKEVYLKGYEHSFNTGGSGEISPLELRGGRAKGTGDVYRVRADQNIEEINEPYYFEIE